MKFVEALAKMKPGDIIEDVNRDIPAIVMAQNGDVEWSNGRTVDLEAYLFQIDFVFIDRECTWQEAIQAWIDGKTIEHRPNKVNTANINRRSFNKKVMHEFRCSIGRFEEGQWYILGGDK